MGLVFGGFAILRVTPVVQGAYLQIEQPRPKLDSIRRVIKHAHMERQLLLLHVGGHPVNLYTLGRILDDEVALVVDRLAVCRAG